MMKKLILLITILIATVGGTYAQRAKVTSAQSLKNSGKIAEAIAAINEAVDQSNPKADKSYNWSRAWEVRGEIYKAVYNSKDANVKKLIDDPLKIAFESYKKATELDPSARSLNIAKINFTLLTTDFTDQAINKYNEEQYAAAFESFKTVLAIQDLPFMKEASQTVDTGIIFNAGLSAFNAEMYDDAVKYFREAAKYDFNGASVYDLIVKSYLIKADTVQAISALEEGFKKYPDSSDLLTILINLNLGMGNDEQARKFLDVAIKQDPTNASYYFVQGDLFDRLEDEDSAIKSYLKAIEMDPNYFDPYYNLGVIYYNRGVKQSDVANAVPTSQVDKYEIEKNKADDEFKRALPYMEKAAQADSKEPVYPLSLETLKILYYRLKMTDKYEEVVKKLEAL